MEQLHTLSNPLASVEQLSTSGSQLDGVPADLETSVRYAGAQLTQAAGILLRLPQEIIAQAIVVYYRFYAGSEGGSFRTNAAKVAPLNNKTMDQQGAKSCVGCFCSRSIHDRKDLVSAAVDALRNQCLYLPDLSCLSTTTSAQSIGERQTGCRSLPSFRRLLSRCTQYTPSDRIDNPSLYFLHYTSRHTPPSRLDIPPDPRCPASSADAKIHRIGRQDPRAPQYRFNISTTFVSDTPAARSRCGFYISCS